ncbi:MAG: hypothetical protein ACK40R_02515 [Thermomonas sp.]
MISRVGAALIGMLAMACTPQAVAKDENGSILLQIDVEATVQADGSVADVQTDPALPASIQARVKRGIETWRYAPLRWQGQAVPVRIAQQIKVAATPLSESRTALRIVEVTSPALAGADAGRAAAPRRVPPRFPPGLVKAGVDAILVYAVLFGENGVPQAIQLMYPATQDSTSERLDRASRKALHEWVVPHTFRGTPIACRAKVPITFVTARNPDLLRQLPEVDALFEAYVDRCPAVRLETPVVGTML